MITFYELYLLNLILDGHDILEVPTFANIRMNALLADSHYTSLIEKGYMESPETLTELGTKFVKNIDLYKHAQKYIKIGSLIIGIYKQGYGIALYQSPFALEYDFSLIDLNNFMKEMTDVYPFLGQKETISAPLITSKEITYDELQSQYSLQLENCLYLSTLDINILREQKKDMVTNELYFYDNHHVFCYDRNKNLLSNCSMTELTKKIEKRMMI